MKAEIVSLKDKTMRARVHPDSQIRQKIAQISARIMVQESIDDYYLAKCKAAAQLGITHTKHLPSNSEIEEEVLLYQRLFHADRHRLCLCQLRQAAVEAMRLFADFMPRLVGTVLEGTAHQHSEITLHLFTHTPEEVTLFLIDKKIPYQLSERRFRLPRTMHYPSYHFMAGEQSIVLIVFGLDDIRQAPPSPVDGKPMRRADLRVVENLLRQEKCDEL